MTPIEVTSAELIATYAAGRRNFRWADLRGANLRGANLAKANLIGADLIGANLIEANLTEADLTEADLVKANLAEANLAEADLTGANLAEADLHWANLAGADLRWANLRWANLAGANLTGANLAGTVLDPLAVVPAPTPDECTEAGLTVEGDFVLGWRTAESQVVTGHSYEPGRCYAAPWFSVDRTTECHPGMYFSSREWLEREHPFALLVRVAAVLGETVHAGDKWRAKRLLVLPDEETPCST